MSVQLRQQVREGYPLDLIDSLMDLPSPPPKAPRASSPETLAREYILYPSRACVFQPSLEWAIARSLSDATDDYPSSLIRQTGRQ